MKNSFTVFYSWQSDIRRNRNLIQNCIEKAIKEIRKTEAKGIELEINIDRDTANRGGSPAIADTIFQKIRSCDIFICDTTIINKNKLTKLLRYRLTPNPNVLIELGYAIDIVGWDRVILVNDTKFSAVEDLPFDIRGHRITSFKSSDTNSKDNLSKQLKKAISYIINNYDNIIAEQQKTSSKIHDLNIYNQTIELCNEVTLIDSISLCVNSLYTNQVYLDYWDSLQEFYKLSINLFIDKELDELIKVFLKNLKDFNTIITKHFNQNDESNSNYFIKMMDGETLTEAEKFSYKQSLTYIPHKEPFHNENWEDADKRIYELEDKLYKQGEKVKLSYRDFVMKIKQKLM